MNAPSITLDFIELESMDAPDDGWDCFRGFTVGVALGAVALSLT